jgi:hypothetical protein
MDTYDLLFDVVLVDRGETSIAKDWKLCVLENGIPHRYDAKLYSDETKTSFGDRTSIAHIFEASVAWKRHTRLASLHHSPKTVS